MTLSSRAAAAQLPRRPEPNALAFRSRRREARGTGQCRGGEPPGRTLPQVDFPTVLVSATLAGASAEIMASSVATPLERQIGQIAGITQMTSFSALGATSITVQFDLNRNIDLAAQDVQVDLRVGICQGVTMALPGKVRAVT